MGFDKRNSSYPQFTDHCFTGDYPIKPIDAMNKNIDRGTKISIIRSNF